MKVMPNIPAYVLAVVIGGFFVWFIYELPSLLRRKLSCQKCRTLLNVRQRHTPQFSGYYCDHCFKGLRETVILGHTLL